MKKLNLLLPLALIICFATVNTASAQKKLKDKRDKTKYKTVKIGKQVWMAQNLAFVTDTGSYAFDNKDENIKTYGRLYSWNAAMKACPSGWHLPTDDEWKVLEKYLGMSDTELEKTWKRTGADGVALKLKSKSSLWLVADVKATNSSGFNALPAGMRSSSVDYSHQTKNAVFWTSTKDGNRKAFVRSLDYEDARVFRDGKLQKQGYSVRCVKDNN